jgi:hypothetical protein
VSQLVLIGGVIQLLAGIALGFSAWRSWQARIATERNAERYAAWRGRGDRSAPDARVPLSGAEQRRLVIAIVLVVLGAVTMVIGLSAG